MIAGDKNDLEATTAQESNQKNYSSTPSTSMVDSGLDCNIPELVGALSNPPVLESHAADLVTEIEASVSEVLKDLIKLRNKNEDLQILIEKSKDVLMKTDDDSFGISYFENFDKYFMYSTNILTQTVTMMAEEYNDERPAEDVLEEITDSFHTEFEVSSMNEDNKPVINISSFNGFLEINRIHDIVDDMVAIGHGGEGRVFRATMKTTGDPVVVKSYFMDCEQSSRIEYAMLVLCHDVKGVKKPVGLFQTNSNYYLVMEDNHKSIPLDVLAEKGILDERQIQNLFSQMIYILYDLRNKYIKHRDVKLDNFLLNTENGRLTIIDFGWAMYTAIDCVLVEEVNRSGETLMGTFDYLPPEADSEPGSMVSYDKATVYALGCILLELFFGYQGKVRSILAKESLVDFVNRLVITKSRPISKGAFSILDRCLKTNIDDRFGLDDIMQHPWVPSDKIDNSIFRDVSKPSTSSNNGIASNTSLPCIHNRHFSANSY